MRRSASVSFLYDVEDMGAGLLLMSSSVCCISVSVVVISAMVRICLSVASVLFMFIVFSPVFKI